MTARFATRHAGLIALRREGLWTGALITGPSGAGKSDLALRALTQGFRLVADDRVIIFVSGERLWGRAPPPLKGLLEHRGLGVLAEPQIPLARVALIVRCEKPDVALERVPDCPPESLFEIRIPVLNLHALENSAPAKLRRALEHLGV
jgi:serine kinase of HPr protein (carbohydrate metabolism regulator)